MLIQILFKVTALLRSTPETFFPYSVQAANKVTENKKVDLQNAAEAATEAKAAAETIQNRQTSLLFKYPYHMEASIYTSASLLLP